MIMKISFNEFEELQRQLRIRDYCQDIHVTLLCLEQLIEKKDKKQIINMASRIHFIENEAVENILEMIRGDEND